MKKISFVFAMSLAVLAVRGDDFGMWSEIGLTQNLGVKGLSASADVGFRANNSLRSVDRWSAGFGLSYDLFRWLKVGAGYTYMYSYSDEERKENYKSDNVTWEGYNLTHGYWRSKNRFTFSLKSGFDAGRFSFSLRERYQLTGYNSAGVTKDKYRFNLIYDENNNIVGKVPQGGYPEYGVPDRKDSKSKEYLRSKLEASYSIRNCHVDPFVSVELENNLRDGFKLDEVRYVAGLEWKISKQANLSGSYHFNKGSDADNDEDLNAVEISLKLKNLFGGVQKKPKKN